LVALRQCVSGDVLCIDLTVTIGRMFETKEGGVRNSAVCHLFVCLLNDYVSNSEYTASVISRINKQLFGKNLEGSGCGINEVLYFYICFIWAR
jgi:hypothetical protein